MNKKLLAAAIAAAVVAAPAAFAESTVYGKIHTSVDSVDRDATNGTKLQDNFVVSSRASRLGFKGSEDLGNGLKAIYQLEMQFNSDGGTAQAAAATGGGLTGQRNTFVGLAGDWGTFLVGRHDTPAKIAFYAQGNEDLSDSILDLNGANPVGVFNEVRANNAIAYVSPNFSGFTIAGAVVPGEEVPVAGNTANNADSIADHYSLGLMYAGGGLKAGVGYEEIDNQVTGAAATSANVDREMLQAGASYTFGAFKIGASYEDTDGSDGVGGFAANEEYTAWAITGKATFGNNAIMALYTTAEGKAAGVKTMDKDGWGIGAEHNFSKRTKVYAAYASGEDDAAAAAAEKEDTRWSLGMIHSF